MEPVPTLVFLVRHAKAGDRERWRQPDHLRPLSPPGIRQALHLAGVLRAHGVERVTEVRSSPMVRCRQTVEPLARELGGRVVDDPILAEGTGAEAILDLLTTTPDAVLCSHGDVIGDTVDRLDRMGLLGGEEPRIEKASTWVLRLLGGEVVGAEYVPPPPHH